MKAAVARVLAVKAAWLAPGPIESQEYGKVVFDHIPQQISAERLFSIRPIVTLLTGSKYPGAPLI
jgi:hypothetical protein